MRRVTHYNGKYYGFKKSGVIGIETHSFFKVAWFAMTYENRVYEKIVHLFGVLRNKIYQSTGWPIFKPKAPEVFAKPAEAPRQ